MCLYCLYFHYVLNIHHFEYCAGCKHVKGILLFGPPGTGKTLMARQIGKMLNAREPKIVNGPQILDKYVGESEANIRRLFADAEEEEKRVRQVIEERFFQNHSSSFLSAFKVEK